MSEEEILGKMGYMILAYRTLTPVGYKAFSQTPRS